MKAMLIFLGWLGVGLFLSVCASQTFQWLAFRPLCLQAAQASAKASLLSWEFVELVSPRKGSRDGYVCRMNNASTGAPVVISLTSANYPAFILGLLEILYVVATLVPVGMMSIMGAQRAGTYHFTPPYQRRTSK